MATRKTRIAPERPKPPTWTWSPNPGELATVQVVKDRVQWAVFENNRHEGGGGDAEQTIAEFLRDGPCWSAPADVCEALRAWCKNDAWRELAWTDELSVHWVPVGDGPGQTLVGGALPPRVLDGDRVDAEVKAAKALGFRLVSDDRMPRGRRVSLSRPWQPPAP